MSRIAVCAIGAAFWLARALPTNALAVSGYEMSATCHFIEARLFNMLTRPLSDDARRAIDDGWPPLYVTNRVRD